MKTRLLGLARLPLALAICASLAFGTKQALATARSCQACTSHAECEVCCIDAGFETGICPNPGGGECLCG